MKNIFNILLLILLVSCSKDSLNVEPKECLKECVLNTVQITVNGIHNIITSKKVSIPCDATTSIFNVLKDNKDLIIGYQVYRCN